MLHSLVVTDAVILGITVVLCGVLVVAKEALHVDEDPRIQAVLGVLPQANCGACGFVGCSEFAKAVVEGRAECGGCPIGGGPVAHRIATIMGVTLLETHPRRPIIHCGARTSDRLGRVRAEAVDRCLEAHQIGVVQACTYGCLGFGDCVAACDFDALHMVDGLPVVDYDRCTGCGACVDVCPRKLIELIPFTQTRMPVIACANSEPGRSVRQVCGRGCIGCGLCQRYLPELFHLADNLAVVDYAKLNTCLELAPVVRKCPTKAIACVGGPEPPSPKPPSGLAESTGTASAASAAGRSVP